MQDASTTDTPSKSRRRKLPWPEIVLLVITPTVILGLLFVGGMLNTQRFGVNFWKSLIYLRFFGWQIVYFIGAAVLLYLAFSTLSYWAARRRSKNEPDKASQHAVNRFRIARNSLWLLVMLTYAFTVNFIAMNALCQPSRQRVIQADEFLMRADHAIFGSYVPFEMHEHAFFQAMAGPMLFSYEQLSWVIGLVLIGLFLFDCIDARECLLTFSTVTFLAMPFWFAVPAVAPDEAFRWNELGTEIPRDIALETAAPITHLNPRVAAFLALVEPYESSPEQGVFAITCLPSLHVAWGMLALWFGCKLWAKSAILLVPWALLNAMGAIFTLQHYAIDIIAGMIVTAVGVAIVHGLCVRESHRGQSSPPGYEIFRFFIKDILRFGVAAFRRGR